MFKEGQTLSTDQYRNSEVDLALVTDAIDELPEGFILCSADDKIIFCNKRQKELFPFIADLLVPGTPFADVVRKSTERGLIAAAIGREEDWIAERMAAHLAEDSVRFEQKSTDSTWVEIHEMKLANGCRVGIRTDITDRKRSEEALQRSERRFRDIAEVASDWYWEMDSDLRFTYFSERVEEVVGVPAAFHLGKTREELAGEDATTEKWKRHFNDLKDHKPFRDFRYDRKGPEGQIQYLSSSGKPVFDDEGSFRGYIGIGSDLTYQVNVEERERLANGRLAAAIEALNEPFALWDIDDRLVIGNQQFREINKAIDDKAEPGTRYPDFAQALLDHGLIPEATGREEKWLKGRIETHLNPSGPFEQKRLDGGWYMIYDQRFPDGSTATISTDITKVKSAEAKLSESQERFKDFASVSADWFWEQDKDLRFTNVTEDNVSVTGMKQEDHYGKTRRETDILDVSEEEMTAHEEQLMAREPFSDFQFSRIKQDGNKVYLSVSGKPIFDAMGNFSGYRGAGHDITDRRAMEEQLRAAQRMEAVGQLTGGVAHDFNNLLAVVLGNAELLEGKVGEDDEALQYVEALKRAVDRASSLTGRLLAFSRQQILTSVPVEISDLIGGLEEMLQRTLGETIDLKIVNAENLRPVTIDPHQFENALLNMAINARDAMPRGGLLVIKTANVKLDEKYAKQHEEVTPGDYVEVAVSDAGTGIPPEVMAKVFEPFFTTKEVGKGSGLGLSMVYGFAKQSSGHVTIHSEVNIGTTVKLYLPRSLGAFAGEDARDDTK
jgi:PAS domain S-box-containing protein